MLRDDVVVPVSLKGGRHHYHFHGAAAWLFFAGFVCLGASVVIVIARRLKAPSGEKAYQRMAGVLGAAGAFVILAMMVLKLIGLI